MRHLSASEAMNSFQPVGLAIGVTLELLTTEEGGRTRPIGDSDYPPGGYRPNWGLPGMTPPQQTGGPVLCFEHIPVAPGDTLRAVIVPMFPDDVPAWRELVAGDALLMYDGTRIHGRAAVAWSVDTVNCPPPRGTPVMQTRLSDDDLKSFDAWAKGGPTPRP